MLNMVELLEDTQKKWRNAVQENNRLKLEIEHLEKTNSPKISENFENDESFLSANPSSLFSNECKKRRSSVFLRRSLSLPARNKVKISLYFFKIQIYFIVRRS